MNFNFKNVKFTLSKRMYVAKLINLKEKLTENLSIASVQRFIQFHNLQVLRFTTT